MNKKNPFPDPRLTTPQGLLAVGGNLSPETLLEAYHNGIFPWYRDGGLIHWYCPPQRMVLFPSEIKISHSLKQVLNSKKFSITQDKAFQKVIQFCSEVHAIDKGNTWIDDVFINAYTKMHELGYAHSVEVWQNEELAGGLYGVAIGKMFCGESMFSNVSNASKVALVHVCRNNNYSLIDCQVPTPHLMSMGARIISRDEFLSLIKKVVIAN
jgi:leucyl/phenylalanyl-tRNA--protein transferase